MRHECGVLGCDNLAVEFISYHSGECRAIITLGKEKCSCSPMRTYVCADHFDKLQDLIGEKVKPY